MKEYSEDLRNTIPVEEFDYLALLSGLQGYAYPRDKITELLKKGIIIRVKKGFYIFGKRQERRPFSREILANMIYGPSYVSLEYALHYHGLIPERVETLTSVTSGRGRRFSTPVGLFTYHSIPMAAYSPGITRIELEGGRSFLIATPEKALSDKIYTDHGTGLHTRTEMKDYLVDSLRIDSDALVGLDVDKVGLIADHYRSRKIRLLIPFVKWLASEGMKK